MQKTLLFASLAGLTLLPPAQAVLTLSTGLRSVEFDAHEITTTSATTTFYAIKDNNPTGIGQSFTATVSGSVDALSFLTARVYSGYNFEVNVYQLFNGDGVTPEANPSRFRTALPAWASLLKTYTFDSNTVSINSAGGDDMFTLGLSGDDAFEITTGSTYMVSVESTDSGSGVNAFLWDYANANVYAGGTYGLPNGGSTAARDLGLGVSIADAIVAVPEPSAVALLIGLGAILGLRRRR